MRSRPLRSALTSAGSSGDAVVESRNGDAAVVVVHRRQNFAQHPQRILRRAAEQPGVQVAIGAGQPDLLVDQAAQRRGDRRRLLIPHAGVADQREVELELVGMVTDETKQVLRAALLLALDHHGDRQRQRAGHRPVGAAGFDEGHGLPLIVAGAAGDNYFSAVRQGLEPRLERRMGPLGQRIDRLHVVVAVEQDMRLAVARFCRCRTCRSRSDGPASAAPRRQSRCCSDRRRHNRRRRGRNP